VPGVGEGRNNRTADRSRRSRSDARCGEQENGRGRREESAGMNGRLAERAGRGAFIEGRFLVMRRLMRGRRGSDLRHHVQMCLRDEGLQRESDQDDERQNAPAGASSVRVRAIFAVVPHWPVIRYAGPNYSGLGRLATCWPAHDTAGFVNIATPLDGLPLGVSP